MKTSLRVWSKVATKVMKTASTNRNTVSFNEANGMMTALAMSMKLIECVAVDALLLTEFVAMGTLYF